MARETGTGTSELPAAMGTTLKDMSAILENFVPKGEYNQLFTELEKWKADHGALNEKLKGGDPAKLRERIDQLETNVRSRSYRDAYNKLVEQLGINPDFSDEVYELSKVSLGADQDEPDVKKMKGVLKDFLELKPKFRAPDPAEEQQQQSQPGELVIPQEAPSRPKLHTADTTGKGSKPTPQGKFRYSTADLQNHEWMAVNAKAYAKAIQDGTAYKVG